MAGFMDVALVQINNSFSGQNYLPYSAAILQSYFQGSSSASSSYSFLPFVYKRDSVDNILLQISTAKVLGISLYAWNTNLSLAIAKEFKAKNPESLVFAGGPSVPDQADDFLEKNPFIDITLHNEGELPFTILLERYAQGLKLTDIPSTSIRKGGQVIKTANAERITDLSLIPSPFLAGTFDKTLSANPNENWIGLWETNRGCPFTCTYCDWGSATGSKKIGLFDYERLEKEMLWFSENKVEYIFCCDANFGLFPRDPDIARMVGEIKKRTGYPHALSVQNTKNSTERSYETQKILCDYGLNKGVTLSMQTMSNDALKSIKRSNIRLSSYLELQKRFINDGIPTYSDLILALPGETKDSYINGLSSLIESGQHNRIQFNNLSILPNAEMAKPAYIKEHGLKTVITDIINMHGSLQDDISAIPEQQELVIETNSLSKDDWMSVRAISWLVAFLYFDKVCQVPLAIANGPLGISFNSIIDSFTNASSSNYPVINGIYQRLLDEAKAITQGGPEYVYSEKYLSIYWPVDELLFIELCTSGKLQDLHDEVSRLLSNLLKTQFPDTYEFYGKQSVDQIFREACNFNQWLINYQVPKPGQEKPFKSYWNIPHVYQSRLQGQYSDIKYSCFETEYELIVAATYDQFSDWLQEVVWYGNKKGNYLHSYKLIEARNQTNNS
jgi:radical SAM superfamily enzyme YgiQ (UPF0313 family)